MQIHDFNPGFGPAVSPVGSNGFGTRTFWTTAIPESDVEVHFGAGKAEMRVDNLNLRDYGTLANATGPNFDNPNFFDPAVVSFDVVWSDPITRRVSVPDGTLGNHYAGEYVENQVTVTWSGANLATGFSFTANPGTFATSPRGAFAELGHEQNGVFAQGDDGGSGAFLVRNALAQGHEGKDLAVHPLWVGLAASRTGSALKNQPTQTPATMDMKSPVANRASAAHRAHERLFELAANPSATLSTVLSESGPHGEDILFR
jgi:hypothetical protein